MFGLGLIGRAVLDFLSRSANPAQCYLPFAWEQRKTQHDQLCDILATVQRLAADHDATGTAIDVVWSAGRAGFSATRDQLDLEASAFEEVVSLSTQVASFSSTRPLRFHLLSSAGGLFEQKRNVNPACPPLPLRPYGHAKLEQEQRLLSFEDRIDYCIYRPSSVYGYERGGRSGLVATLIQNAISNRTSHIFGGLSVQRDYVHAGDVGRFIADRIMVPSAASGVFLLASGKPTTTGEVIRLIEKMVRQRLSVQIQLSHENTADNTFQASCLPRAWTAMPLEVGVKKTLLSIKQDLLLDRSRLV